MQADDFIQALVDDLRADECLEVRAIRDHEVKQHYLTDPEKIAQTRDYYDARGFHVYFGVNPRAKGRLGGGRANVTSCRWLWADFDARTYPGGKAEALETLEGFALAPTYLIDSGGGYHAYWQLTEAITDRQELAVVEELNRSLAAFLQSDPKVYDLPRIMRLPGSRNHKADYATPPVVKVLEYRPGALHLLGSFRDIFPEATPAPARERHTLPGGDDHATLREALRHIDPRKPNLEYDQWTAILMALHSVDFPVDDAAAWADGRPGEVERKWASFQGAGVSVGTVYYHARRGGYVPPATSGVFVWEPADPNATAGSGEGGTPGPKLNFMPLPDFLAADFGSNDWLVDGILMQGSMSLLVAKPKVGKSTLAANLAFAVGSGKAFLGREVTPGAVLYLSLDQEPAPMQEQFKRVANGLLAPGEPAPQLAVHAQYALGYDLVPELAALLGVLRPRLLIVDTLQKLVDIKNGNDYQEVVRALAPYSALAQRTGVHIMFLHHAHKGVAEGADQTMGSAGFAGAVGSTLILKKIPGMDPPLISFEVEQRWAATVPETIIDFDPQSRVATLRGDRETVTREAVKGKILNFLGFAHDRPTMRDIHEALPGLDGQVIDLATRELVATNHVRASDGKPRTYALVRWARPPDPADAQAALEAAHA